MSFTATRTGSDAAARIRPGTSRSQRRICARSSASASPASVGEKSFSTSSGGVPQAWGTPPLLVEKRSEEHTSELQSRSDLVCRLLLEKKNNAPATLTLADGRIRPFYDETSAS